MRKARYLVLLVAISAVSFSIGAAVAQYNLARPVVDWVLSSHRTDECLGARAGEICLSGSTSLSPPFEDVMLRELPAPGRARAGARVASFAAYLKDAVGWSNIPGSDVTCSQHTSGARECFLRYGSLLRTRFLFADGRIDGPLVILLHGHVSSANKLMGLEPADYMRSVGQVLVEDGYAVAAPDLTHSAATSSRLNGQLVLHGIQLYGLWSRFVCDIAEAFGDRDVIVYGLSNGGIIADHVSILCSAPNITSVIVDDILTDWRAAFYAHPDIHAVQNYGLHYFAPLLHDTSYFDFLLNSNYRKVYLRNRENLPEGLPIECLAAPRQDWRIMLAPLEIPHHVAQIEILQEFLRTQAIDGSRALDLTCLGS